MAARTKSAARRKSAGGKATSRSTRQPADAIALLRADHQNVQQLFEQCEKTRSDDRKQKLAGEICHELTMHAQVEEEIFYPAVREALRREQDLLDEATVEHASVKDLIAQIEGMSAGDDLYDAKVTVLGEYVRHHVKEEQNELFPKVRKTKLDLKALRDRIEARKLELEGGGLAAAKASRGEAPTHMEGGMSGSRHSERGRAKRKEESDSEGILASVARGMGFSGR